MQKLYLFIILVISSLLVFNCNSGSENLFVSYSNQQIEYQGRIDTFQVDGANLYWSGTSMKINFEGDSIQALLQDERGDNYYNIIVDNDSIVVLRPDKTKKHYTLANNLGKGKHTVELFKRTEWDRGIATFFGFQIYGNAKILPKDDAKKRKIEFYGNSITAGYAVEDYSGKDSPDSIYTNNYYSYAYLTAKHFDANYNCICKSGIGITVSWFPAIMPEIYDRLNPSDSSSNWNFSLYTPDIVVVNLLQNDSWLVNMPDNLEFKAKFGDTAPTEEFIINAYKNFISKIRNHYSDAYIICALGSMDATKDGSKWPEYIKNAVNKINDEKIITHFMPFKNTPGHPRIEEQKVMAESLIKFIETNIKW